MSKLILPVPNEFNFESNFQFLQRSPKEILHRIEEGRVVKLLRVDKELILFSVREGKQTLIIDFLLNDPSPAGGEIVKKFVREWFDLETDLKPFYTLAKGDDLLKEIVKRHHGYRIIGQPDLFESLIWAVLGQQINLAFAYTLKQRFVEQHGERLEFEGKHYHLFPLAEKVCQLNPDHLLQLQFSRQKANYTVGISLAFAEGRISKAKLAGMSLLEAKEELMKIKGIGNWTANYALMKTFRHPDAFPLEDAGVHNAIKNQLGLKSKPSLDRVRKIFKKYKGWEAYATLYLWKSL
jgi:DNA-3-methyladenine glycosylase II